MSIQAIIAITSLLATGGGAAVAYEHSLSTGTSVVQGSKELNEVFGADVEKLGGMEAVEQRKADYDLAVSVGIPLAEADLTAEEVSEFARQGSNVIIPCEVGHRKVAELNAILNEAPGATAIPCGGFNPEAPARVAVGIALTPIAEADLSAADEQELIDAGFDSVGSCEGASGVLSEILGAVGAQTWVCGYDSAETNRTTR